MARGWGKSCIVGCQDLSISKNLNSAKIGNKKIKEGDLLTLNGSSGDIYLGSLKLFQNPIDESGPLSLLLSWADKIRKLKVRTNADTPEDCEKALRFGAEGVGLCRTEHMVFDEERVHEFRKMILAQNKDSRKEYLKNLLPFQIKDFYGIFKKMDGLPVTVRLLDPPLHEFINIQKKEVENLAHDMGMSVRSVQEKIDSYLSHMTTRY